MDNDLIRRYVLVYIFIIGYIREIVIFRSFENDVFACLTAETSYSERSVCGKVAALLRPCVGIRFKLCFTNGNKRKTCKVV